MIYPVTSLAFWRFYLVHMRPYLFFVSGVAGWTGLSLAADYPEPRELCWTTFFAFLTSYGFGQALTDTFQVDTDELSAPYRPLSQRIISAKAVRLVSITGLLMNGTILIMANITNIWLCSLSIAGLATYSYIKRHYWFGGPFYNAWIVALLPLMGYLCLTNGSLSLNILRSNIGLIALLSFCAYTNFVLIGYLKDITADRQTGYRTFPVLFGWNATIWVGDGLAMLSSLISLTLLQHPVSLAGLFWLGATISAIWGQGYAHLTARKTEENSTLPVINTVRSFIGWHLAVIVAFRPESAVWCVLFYSLFELVLATRPVNHQI
ncbi:MAG: UbiA family prenyltransferase [Spirosoma sp.]|nr:UbiA family prenyltransferase [Spirosoma sp.]